MKNLILITKIMNTDKRQQIRYFACDFETTVFSGQTDTAVWSAASVEFYTENVQIQGNILDFFDYIFSQQGKIICYFHNLKFDGSFILDALFTKMKYTQARKDGEWLKNSDMPINSFKYLISDMGQWYTITIKNNKKKVIEIRDSLKLLPFSLREIGKSFGTKHKKLEMDYEGFRYPNCPISETELSYIKNDVLVLKEAMEIMFADDHNKLTIGSCCLQEFKNTLLLGEIDYKNLYPDLYEIKINKERFGVESVGEFCRQAYKGAWCYLKSGCENKIYTKGCTNDVNSLYPSMMHSESGNYYPYGLPELWYGNYIPKEALEKNRFYYIKISTKFDLKPNKLPTVQIKHNRLYQANEWLTTSDVYYKGYYFDELSNDDGTTYPVRVILYLTMIDWQMLQEHYDLTDTQIICGMYFETQIGMFDKYINKYKEIKMKEKGAKRTEAKLFLNNLYGKMASSPNSSYKLAYLREDELIGFTLQTEAKKKPGYIAIGAAITAYARRFTIKAAQENYENFIYADTDSIHCCCLPENVKGITIHPNNFCCWKTESTWDEGIFARQKTYIEHVIAEDLEPVEPHYIIKAAGMPKKSNYLLEKSLEYNRSKTLNITEDEQISLKIKQEDIKWIKEKRNISDFKVGLVVPGALKQKRIKGGIVLYEKEHTMR